MTKRDIIKKRNEKCVTYEGICSKNKVTISFIGEKKPPYNVYDSNIVNDKFEYGQLILFDIKKEEASIDNYKKIISFFYLFKRKNRQ